MKPGSASNGERPFARWITIAALLVLGAAALARLPLDYLPRHSFPELTVDLQVAGAADPAEVTRAGLREIESAARSLGRVRGMAGEVRTDGADLTVRFTPGTDPERKAARLESELAGLRRRLPAGSRLAIHTASRTQESSLALVWLTGIRSDDDAEAAAEALRSVPGVRAVQLYGAGREEIRIELRGGETDPSALVETIRGEIEQALEVPAFGFARSGSHRQAVLGGGSLPRFAGEGAPSRAQDTLPVRFEDALVRLPIPIDQGTIPLAALATVRTLRLPPDLTVRYRGEPARALVVQRAPGAPLLSTDRALRERLAALPGLGIHATGILGTSEAEPLRALLLRLFLGGLLAMAAGAAAGTWIAGGRGAFSLGLALPSATAAAANLLWLTGTPLHLTTLAALLLGTAVALPLTALRLAQPKRGFLAPALTVLAAAAAVPVAVGLASEELGPILAEPARAFLLAAAGAVLAAALLPAASSGSGGPRRRAPRPGRFGVKAFQRLALRDPGTALLAAATATMAAITLFGGALIPRPGDLSPAAGDLTITLRLPAGAPLAETEARVRKVEDRLAEVPEIERFWCFLQPGMAQLAIEIRPRFRSPARLARLTARLRYKIARAAAVEVDDRNRPGAAARFGADLEDRPSVDEEGFSYRVVLRGSDLHALQATYDRILHRLDNLKVLRLYVQGWGEPAVQRRLAPSPWASAADAAALAGQLSRASLPSLSLALPTPPGRAQRSLRVVPSGTPADLQRADRVPQEADLLGRPLLLGGRHVVPAMLLRPSDEAVYPRVSRQSGRFVVPIEVRIPLKTREARLERRRVIDRNLAGLRLPASCQLERPPLGRTFWPRERVRLVALALAMPLLLAAVATVRLDSLLRGTLSLVPPALGLLAAAPLVWSGLGQADELTIFALAAALALVLPAAVEASSPAAARTDGSGKLSGARLYRALRRQTPWLLGAIPALVLGLAAPTLGADPSRFRWIVPLRAAALAAGVGLAASALLVAPLRLAAARTRERDAAEVRRRRRPPAWSEPGEPELAVRSLTKVYAPGVKALSAVSFELRPGIVGLLGPNGAGKTTLLRILTGLIEPTRGAVLFRGVPVSADNLAEYRRRIGFLPQEFNAYPGFTAEQFLDHWAIERGMQDARGRQREIEELLAVVGLAEHANRKVRDYSGGMRQRVGIARALLGAPPILIVDEPTTGLDVESRGRFRQVLLEAAGQRIVLFSTHIASDIEAAALRILLLHRGQLRFDGTPEELVERARGRVFRTVVADSDLAELSRLYRVTARVRVLEGIQARAVARPGESLAGEAVEPDLEEAYLAEIDLADAEAGRTRGPAERFAFLDRTAGDRRE